MRVFSVAPGYHVYTNCLISIFVLHLATDTPIRSFDTIIWEVLPAFDFCLFWFTELCTRQHLGVKSIIYFLLDINRNIQRNRDFYIET